MADPGPGRLARLLRHPRAPLAIALLAVTLGLPTLRGGFFGDDIAQVLMVEQGPGVLPRSKLDLYRMIGDAAEYQALLKQGPLPWWTDPGFRGQFFRPATSALFSLDHALYGRSAAGYHLTTILLYGAVALILGALYRRILDPKEPSPDRHPLSTIALLLFVVAAAHGQVVAWIACRHYMVTAVPALLGLIAHVRAREEGWAPGRILGPLGLALSFLGGESAVCAVAYWLAYDLLGPAPQGTAGSLRARLVAALPALGIFAAFLAVYRMRGSGFRQSLMYADPASDPIAFAAAAAWRVPAMLGDLLAGIQTDWSLVFPKAPLLVAAGAAILGVALLYRAVLPAIPEHERAALRWLCPGALGAVIVSAAGFPGPRLLFFPTIGGAVLVAVLLRATAARLAAGAGAGVRMGRWALVAVHVVVAPLNFLAQCALVEQFARSIVEAGRTAEVSSVEPSRVVVVWGSDPSTYFYAPLVRAMDTPPVPGSTWHVLATGKGPHRIDRTGPSTLRVYAGGHPMLDGAFDQNFYPAARFHEGDRFTVPGTMNVTVTAARDGLPTAVEATFDMPLSDPHLCLLVWQDGKLRRLSLPNVGDSLTVEWSPGPFMLF